MLLILIIKIMSIKIHCWDDWDGFGRFRVWVIDSCAGLSTHWRWGDVLRGARDITAHMREFTAVVWAREFTAIPGWSLRIPWTIEVARLLEHGG